MSEEQTDASKVDLSQEIFDLRAEAEKLRAELQQITEQAPDRRATEQAGESFKESVMELRSIAKRHGVSAR
jgi:hypothetical protein